MSDSRDNFKPDHERRLDEVERADARADAGSAAGAMRRDRDALSSALHRDLSRQLTPTLAARFDQAVRDEIDRSLLVNLANGHMIEDHLPVSKVIPRRDGVLTRIFAGTPRFSRLLAAAACLALVAGVTWLAVRPRATPISTQAAANSDQRALPSWAVLPDVQPKQQAIPRPIETLARAPADPVQIPTEVRETRDVGLAITWARRGVLVLRATTAAPRRDHERLDHLAARDSYKSQWDLLASFPAGFAMIPSRPWPIDVNLADADERTVKPGPTPATATIAGYNVSLWPTADALEAARDELERNSGVVVMFERVDALAAFATRDSDHGARSASDITWWKKPANEWSPRIRVPLLLEFGIPPKPATK